MRVLIVEDEGLSRKALRFLLTAHGFQADAVDSAEQAEEVLGSRQAFDVVVVDVDLPGQSGLKLVDWVRQFYPRAKPVLLTAVDRDRLDPAQERGVPYLQKPLDFDKLLYVLGGMS